MRRRLRWFFVLFTLYIAVCAVGGYYLADTMLHPLRRPLSDQEVADFKETLGSMRAQLLDVSITTSDQVILRGWLLRPLVRNGDAVLVHHGLGDNRLGMAGYARLLLAHRYTVLLPDARAHGASGGSLATDGLQERDDIRQWVEFLSSAVRPRCVYGLGESMGASLLLQSLESGARFCAVVAESPLSSFREIAYDGWDSHFTWALGWGGQCYVPWSRLDFYGRGGSTDCPWMTSRRRELWQIRTFPYC